jgi:hypothetical protein
MSVTGYCTIDDVRRALRQADLPGDAAQDVQIVTDAIGAQTEWFEKTYKRHWYDPGTSSNLLPTGPETRDDEESIPTRSAMVAGDDAAPRLFQGDYTRITLARRDATTISELLVRDGDGGYTDWVASNDYDGGRWPDALGDDYVLRVNNGGVSHLYLDTATLYDAEAEAYALDSFVNAVYVAFEYGHEGIPRTARRGIAFRAAADLVEEAAIQIPANAEVYNVETKAEELRTQAEELLGVYEVDL